MPPKKSTTDGGPKSPTKNKNQKSNTERSKNSRVNEIIEVFERTKGSRHLVVVGNVPKQSPEMLLREDVKNKKKPTNLIKFVQTCVKNDGANNGDILQQVGLASIGISVIAGPATVKLHRPSLPELVRRGRNAYSSDNESLNDAIKSDDESSEEGREERRVVQTKNLK